MAPHQRLLHAALGVARDVASKSGIAAGACSHLRERIASRPYSFAEGYHTARGPYHSKNATAEAWATQQTADVLAGWKARVAASSFGTSRRSADSSVSSSECTDDIASVATSESRGSVDDGTAASSPAIRRLAPWQSATATAASSFSAFRPDPDGQSAAGGLEHRLVRHPQHVFVAHRRLGTAKGAAPAATESVGTGRRRQHASSAGGATVSGAPSARDTSSAPATASPQDSPDAGSEGSGPEAQPQPSDHPEGQLGPASRDFVYEGPLAAPVRRLKKLSLFSCACSLAAAPIIVSLSDAASSAIGARASIAVMVATIGVFTTGLLHWFTSPYVHRLAYDAATGTVEARTLTVLARPRIDRFPAAAVRHPQTLRPQATFEVNGKVFYIDPDHFGDADLLALLSPPDPDQPPSPQPIAVKLDAAKH